MTARESSGKTTNKQRENTMSKSNSKSSLISRDMHRAVSSVLREATAATEDREYPTISAADVVAKVYRQFGVPKDAQDDLRILLTQAIKLGCFENYVGVRGRFGGIRRVAAEG